MPAKVNRRLDAAEEIAALQARVTKLESFPANGMTVLASASSTTPITGISNFASNVYLSPATSGNFSLIRPVPIWVVTSFAFGTSAVTTAGTQMFVLLQLMGDAVQIAITPYAVIDLAPTGGVTTAILGSGTLTLLHTPTAAQIAATTNWSCQLWGHISSGTATSQVYSWSITAFQLSG